MIKDERVPARLAAEFVREFRESSPENERLFQESKARFEQEEQARRERVRMNKSKCLHCVNKPRHKSMTGGSLYCDECLYQMSGESPDDCIEHHLHKCQHVIDGNVCGIRRLHPVHDPKFGRSHMFSGTKMPTVPADLLGNTLPRNDDGA